MVPMRLGRRLVLPAIALVTVAAPTLSGCGLFDRGSTLDDSVEYLPADTFSVSFSDREAVAKRLDIDGIDPRDISDDDLERYSTAFEEHREVVVVSADLADYITVMRDAPFNDADVVWEAQAGWGDPHGETRAAWVWKVGDDLDFDALADDLKDKGYDEGESGDLPVYSASRSAIDVRSGTIGEVYPAPTMLNVMLDEDDQIVVGSSNTDALADIAEVIADDADSLADDGSAEDLVEAAEGDPELAIINLGGPTVCAGAAGTLPETDRALYDDLGRPESRALFVSDDDDAKVTLVLGYDSEDAAKEDLDAREALIEDGADQRTREPLSDLGDFEVDQDGDLLVIDEDFDDGPGAAVQAEFAGGGPGFCLPETDR